MIDVDELLSGIGEDNDDSSNYELMLRRLCSIARKYNSACEDLERLKEFTGFNKPFPIMRLPREIRDEIYTHSLRAITPVFPPLPPAEDISIRSDPSKPPAPGLLLANKQIYSEAIEIMYSKNIFYFMDRSELVAFEEQIGSGGCQRVRQICINIRFPSTAEWIADTKDLERWGY